MNEQISIGFSRRLVFAFAFLFAVLAVSGVWQAISSHEAVRAVIILVTFGGMSVAYTALFLYRHPVLLLDDDGLTDVRGAVVVRWHDIEAIHVAERHRLFDHYHDLVLTDARGQTLSLSLDQLTRKWMDVLELIEGRMGRQVPIRRETGTIAGRSQRRSRRTQPSGVSRIPA